MASLIVHDDLLARRIPLSRRLYVRPILKPDQRDWRAHSESVPDDILIVDLIFRCVTRLFEQDGAEPPVGPRICVINLSIGIRDRAFDGSLSPLARLIDWLAWKYKLLFLVSAGNYAQPLELTVTGDDVAQFTAEELQDAVLKQVAAENRLRRLLSPAESVNAISVGAQHSDHSPAVLPARTLDPYAATMPSPINAQGFGFKRAIKPEVLMPGGRVVFAEPMLRGAPSRLGVFEGSHPPGQQVASPGTASSLDAVVYARGTSNATALASRAAIELYDVLDELRGQLGGELIDEVPRAIWLKAMLAHGADWGAAYHTLDNVLKTPHNSRNFKEYASRMLGYGAVDVDRVRECTDFRVMALGGGTLSVDRSHIHQFPLPPSLSGVSGYRKLVITLAWLTPVNPRHRDWRQAHLWFAPPENLAISRDQGQWQAVQRGTLQHEILTGERASAFVDGDTLKIQVSCRSGAGTLDLDIPYSLAVTLEVADNLGITIYEEVRARVSARVQVAAVG